ncbi:hypothetical protein [Ruegeria sp. ANG-R]|uniref:hypothetical protein n=1 Tax=Ruegeria sp. ANG-R TaxID=1577903 RepID=UPI000B28F817|nr:hypothetical protein [Ruegeria sp. ANG-R]
MTSQREGKVVTVEFGQTRVVSKRYRSVIIKRMVLVELAEEDTGAELARGPQTYERTQYISVRDRPGGTALHIVKIVGINTAVEKSRLRD